MNEPMAIAPSGATHQKRALPNTFFTPAHWSFHPVTREWRGVSGTIQRMQSAAAKVATDGKGVDVVLDMVGGDYIERNYEAAAVEGRVVQIAFQRSPKATVDFRRIMLKRLTHTGSTLRARAIPDKGAIARAVEEHVLPLIAAGRVRPLIDSTLPLAQAAAAHARMETSAHIGKIVLTIATQ